VERKSEATLACNKWKRRERDFQQYHCKMPTLKLQTNVPGDAVSTSDFLKEASKAVAKIIGKPESVRAHLCMVLL
jgi:hypothetical protein